MRDKLTPAQVLYSSNEELEKLSNEDEGNIRDFKLKGKVQEDVDLKNANYKKESNYDEMEDGVFKLYASRVETGQYVNASNNSTEKNETPANWVKDEKFDKALGRIFEAEGGFSDDKNDRGGRTNYGITQKTYNDYNKNRGIPIKDVKDITKEETAKIYYENYWKASGADKIQDKNLQYMHFDAAVNHGVSGAKELLKQSGGDFDKYYEKRKEKYENIIKNKPSQEKFRKGWMNRIDKIKKSKEED